MDATLYARLPILAPLRRPEVQQALSFAAKVCVQDGHEGCDDPIRCDDPANRMTPLEFTRWLRLFLEPPGDQVHRGGPAYAPSETRGARWARKQREKRRREAARLTTDLTT